MLFCSKSLILKSESLSSLSLQKGDRERIALDFFKKKSDHSDLLVNRANRSKKTGDSFEKRIFLYVLDIFHPFYAKERLRANRSCYRERFAPVSRGKKRDRSDSFFFTSQSLFCSQKTSDSLQKTMSEFPILHNHSSFRDICSFYVRLFGCGNEE